MKIRPAVPADDAQLVRLYKSSAPDLVAYSGQKFTKGLFRRLRLDPYVAVIVAVGMKKKVIGACTFTLEHADRIVYLESIVVHKKHRGKGVGKELLKELTKIARKKGFRRLGADVYARNTEAIKFHEKLGFRAGKAIIPMLKKI